MSGEKTEKPSEKKLRDAREKGQVPQRKNIDEAACLTFGILGTIVALPIIGRHLFMLFDSIFKTMGSNSPSDLELVTVDIISILTAIVALVLCVACAVLLFHLIIGKFNFTPKAIEPKFEKFNPVNGLKGMFSKTTLYNFLRTLFIFLLISTISSLAIWMNFEDFLYSGVCGLSCVSVVFFRILWSIILGVMSIIILLAAIDFIVQNLLFQSQNKMSKDEVKREYKGQEGDPLIKGKRRELAMNDLFGPTLSDASHVIYSASYLVAVRLSEGYWPLVIVKIKGDGVPRFVARCRSENMVCLNLPGVAREFYEKGVAGNFLSRNAERSIAALERHLES